MTVDSLFLRCFHLFSKFKRKNQVSRYFRFHERGKEANILKMGDGPSDVNDTFIKREAKSEFDAIHPRFMEPLNEEDIREYEIRNHYYCEFCNLFFAPTVRGLKTHFSGDMVQHPPYGSCIYCQGAVFQYKLNNKIHLFHNCKDTKNNEPEKS